MGLLEIWNAPRREEANKAAAEVSAKFDAQEAGKVAGLDPDYRPSGLRSGSSAQLFAERSAKWPMAANMKARAFPADEAAGLRKIDERGSGEARRSHG